MTDPSTDFVPPFTEPPVEAPEPPEPEKSEQEVLLSEIQDILKEHNGMESNIGHGHDYWKKLNRLRFLNLK